MAARRVNRSGLVDGVRGATHRHCRSLIHPESGERQKRMRDLVSRLPSQVGWRRLRLGALALLAVAASVWGLWSQSAGSWAVARPISRLTTREVHALAFSAAVPDQVFLGYHGGVLVSTNGGRDWSPIASPTSDAMALAVAHAQPQRLYLAGHEGFYASTDGGASWQAVPADLRGRDWHGLAVDPLRADRVYAYLARTGVYYSTDGGRAWTLLSEAVPPTVIGLTVGETPAVLYAAAAHNGLWKSSDGGKTWAWIENLPGEGVLALAYDAGHGRLLATTLGSGGGLYHSEDAGATWTPLRLTGTIVAVAVNPSALGHYLAVDDRGRVFASPDAGATWRLD